jgi:hypothetical protein
MTTTINITEKVRNYQGSNSFVNKMKDSLSRYGSLTVNQINAVTKILNSQTTVNYDSLSDELKKIVDYNGDNSFVKDIKNKLMTYGTLSHKQIQAVLNQIESEENKKRTMNVTISVVGKTIQLRRMMSIKLKEQYNLDFNPILIDVSKITAMSPKAIKVVGRLTSKRGKVCTCCMKTLTDEFSMLTGVGPTCAEKLGIKYIRNANEAKRFRDDYLKRVEEIGDMEFWIPTSQVKIWDEHIEFLYETTMN